MIKLHSFPFVRDKFDKIKAYHFGLNWPVVYIQEDGREMYIGQTTNLYIRSQQHYKNPEHAKLKRIHAITDEEFNLSAAYDFESLLIQYVAGDGKYTLQNGNGGLVKHNYYEKEKYLAKLEVLWPDLQDKGLVQQNLKDIRNSDLFKFSPYKSLTEDQLLTAIDIEESLLSGDEITHIVNGSPGTGKTILALYLLKRLRENPLLKNKEIALIVPMSGLRSSLKSVVKRIPSLGADSVIGPSDVAKKMYDIVIIDESHRLSRRVNLANYAGYDRTNKLLNLPKDATQLDWIYAHAKQRVFFYDANQNVIPRDVQAVDFNKLDATRHVLISQMRVAGGDNYLDFINNLFELSQGKSFDKTLYDFHIYDDLRVMINDIKKRDAEHSLARVVAGYAWLWKTKKGDADYDIEINGLKFVWNTTLTDWVNSKNAINEVGCIHTIQGYDLNYAGVIIGPEISYDEQLKTIVIDEKKYMDFNGKRSITDHNELKRYIINIYKTLLTRGIKGTYVYIVDDKLRMKFKEISIS